MPIAIRSLAQHRASGIALRVRAAIEIDQRDLEVAEWCFERDGRHAKVGQRIRSLLRQLFRRAHDRIDQISREPWKHAVEAVVGY